VFPERLTVDRFDDMWMWTLLIVDSGSILRKSRMFLYDLALSMAELSIQSFDDAEVAVAAYVDAIHHHRHHPQHIE
jgi:hypothetical protein